MMEFVSWDKYSIPNCFWKVIIHSFHGSKKPPTRYSHAISMAFPWHFHAIFMGHSTHGVFLHGLASQLMCRGVHLRAGGTAFQLHRHLQRIPGSHRARFFFVSSKKRWKIAMETESIRSMVKPRS